MNLRNKQSLLLISKLFLFGLVSVIDVHGQTAIVGKDDFLRELQLQGKLNVQYSLLARPFFTNNAISSDSFNKLTDGKDSIFGITKKRLGQKGSLEITPVSMSMRFNSHHPYGWGTSGMIQAKGLQSVISGGVYVSSGILSVQLQPQLSFAANPAFEHNALYGATSKGTYVRLFPGQSSIRLNKGAISLGISTENMWWGPGIYNSLLMSSNAPGFLHLTFNTVKPVKTPIGSFEWQLVSGKLYEDTMVLREDKNLTTAYYNPTNYDGSGYGGPYDPKAKWRYFNGLTITYQPKWIKGLFLGINRIAYTYNDNLQKGNTNFFHSYLPLFFGVFRENYPYNDSLGAKKRYKQMLSLHARYIFPQYHMEFYGEYGWGDNTYNLRDLAMNLPHSRAYILGARKMVPLTRNRWLDVHAEMTQLAQASDYIPRTAGNWYGYQGGYTNQSRIIGAGIGMGSNVQTLTATLIDGWQRLGIKLERLQHDPNNYPVYWSDLSVGFIGQKRYGRLLVNAQMQFIRSRNYIWEAGKNRFNLFSTLNLTYRL